MTTRLAILATLLLAAAPAAGKPREGVPITKEDWTAAVGFAPEAYPGGFAPGTVVTKQNRAALGVFVPAGKIAVQSGDQQGLGLAVAIAAALRFGERRRFSASRFSHSVWSDGL